jgi:hypothetical protein
MVPSGCVPGTRSADHRRTRAGLTVRSHVVDLEGPAAASSGAPSSAPPAAGAVMQVAPRTSGGGPGAYEAAQNLRRVVASVTDARETARGLAVVLG